MTPPGVPGEICGQGPQVMSLYFKEPDKTEEALLGGWFHSGDLAGLGTITAVIASIHWGRLMPTSWLEQKAS